MLQFGFQLSLAKSVYIFLMKKFLPILLLLPVVGYGQARFDHFDAIELDKIKKTETERIAKIPLSQSKTAVNVDENP